MSIKHWLKKQLTKVKTKEEAWSDFANILGEALDVHVEPYLDRVKRRVSLFEQEKEDLQIELKELGDFFSFGDIDSDNLAITILQRKDQIHFKRTLSPLISTLNREFEGLGVSWKALYNPIGGEYGLAMKTLDSIKGSEDKYWLTSRGLIQVPLNHVVGTTDNLNERLYELEREIERVVYPLIPLRIVFDGVLYVMIYRLEERPETIEVDFISVHQALKGPESTKIYRMDAFSLDYMPLDEMISYAIKDEVETKKIESTSALPTPVEWGAYRFDVLPIDQKSLDTKVFKSFFENLKTESVDTKIKVGGDLTYSYRMDSMPLDFHNLDYSMPSPSDYETISQNHEVYSELATPKSRWPQGSENDNVQVSYVSKTDIVQACVPRTERKETIRLISVISEGETLNGLNESVETFGVSRDADAPEENFSVESREISTHQSLRKDSTTSLDSMTLDRDFPT